MWQLKQLERLHEIEPNVIDSAVEELFKVDSVLREKVVVGAYIDGDINFGKAAELLGIHPVKLREVFLARGIPVRIGVELKEDLLAEGIAAKGIREG
jgi:predicted HTH domain antitoxin